MDEQLKDQLRQAYDSNAAARDAKALPDWRSGLRKHFIELLGQEGKHSLLELGAGTGLDGQYFQEFGFDVLCTDLSPENVRYCQEKGLNARVMDNTKFVLPAHSFDAVYSMNSLLHLPKDELPGVLESIRTVLKPGGLFFMGVYGGIDQASIWEEDKYEPKRFFAFYSDDELKNILSKFFDIESFMVTEVDSKVAGLHHQSFILRNLG